MIGIIDYGSGNLKSVSSAFRYIGEDVRICGKVGELGGIDKIVLPGVGSSVDAMKGLRERGLIEPILKHIERGRPFFGICLGLQLLFEKSSEGTGCDCLGVIRGEVKHFQKDKGLKIPQIGWNTVRIVKEGCPVLSGIKDNTYFYFVHSFYCEAASDDDTAGETEYGIPYASMIWRDNIYAVQFHPERSQLNGLKLLENFAKI